MCRRCALFVRVLERNYHLEREYQGFSTPCRKLKSDKDSLLRINSKIEKSFSKTSILEHFMHFVENAPKWMFLKLFSNLELSHWSEFLLDFSLRHGVGKHWCQFFSGGAWVGGADQKLIIPTQTLMWRNHKRNKKFLGQDWSVAEKMSVSTGRPKQWILFSSW